MTVAATAPPLRRLVRRAAALYLASRRARPRRTRCAVLAVPLAVLLCVTLSHTRLSGGLHGASAGAGDAPDAHAGLPHLTDAQALQRALARAAFTPPSLQNLSRPPRLVIATAVNYPFRSYLHNLFCSMRRSAPLSAAHLLVVSMDPATQRHASAHGFESLLLAPHTRARDGSAAADAGVHAFGSPAFNLLSKQKLYAVLLLLRAGVDVLFSDADVTWCGDAAHAISALVYRGFERAPHLLMQTAWPRSLLNSGFYYVRSDADSIALFEAFLRYEGSAEENDQVILNRVLCRAPYGGETVLYADRRGHSSAPQRALPELCRWRGRAEARVLDAHRFPTGGELFDSTKLFHHPRDEIVGMCDRRDVLVLHNNCILSEKKLARFVVKGMWWVLPGYKCRDAPAPPTLEARRRCGVSKCGADGDYRSFVRRQKGAAHRQSAQRDDLQRDDAPHEHEDVLHDDDDRPSSHVLDAHADPETARLPT